jgi:hypothetical protein
MKCWRLILIVFSSIILKASAQTFTRQDLLTDLTFLNKAIVTAHPSQIRYPNSVLLDSIIRTVTNAKQDAVLSNHEYEYTIRKALVQLGCMHTFITQPLMPRMKRKLYTFPVSLYVSDDSLYALDWPKEAAGVHFEKGTRIVSINGVSSKDIVQRLTAHQAPDGYTKAFGNRLFNYNSKALLTNWFGTDSVFKVRNATVVNHTDNWAYNLKTQKTVPQKKDSVHAVMKGKKETFGWIDNHVAYLKITAFKNRRYKRFYKNVFKKLKAKDTHHLVIDLRDNLGGNRFNGACLLSYLMKEDAYYDIIRSKKTVMPFLNFSNKLKFAFSYFFYDVGRIHRRSKTENGDVTFHCKIKKRKTVFEGQVVVLTNGYSSSTSAIVASNLRHHAKQVTIIGEQTGGGESGINGGSYPTLYLPKSKIGIQFATYYFLFDNRANNRNGLVPDISVKSTWHNFLSEDIELKAALDYLKNTIQH